MKNLVTKNITSNTNDLNHVNSDELLVSKDSEMNNLDVNKDNSIQNHLLDDFNNLLQETLTNLPIAIDKDGENMAFNNLNILINTADRFRKNLSPEEESYFKNDFQQKILPHINQSELCKYSYDKPRGYAGDFMAMQMIWNGRTSLDYRYRGKSDVGKAINAFTLDSANCKANVYRVYHLKKKFLSTKIVKLPQLVVAQ